MFLGSLCFEFIPVPMLRFFSGDPEVIRIGETAFRIIGLSFVPLAFSLTYPVLFQAVGASFKSSMLTVIWTVFLFVPLGYLFSQFGLSYFWLTYPVTDGIITVIGFFMSRQFFRQPYLNQKQNTEPETVLQPSHPGVIITIARQHGSSGKQIGKLVAERLCIPFYYKEMTALAAQESGLDKEFISDLNRNAPQMLQDLYLSNIVVQQAVIAQKQIIERIAENGSCVIVGRAADYVLREHPNVLRVFIQAPLETRIQRVMKVYGDTREKAERNIRRADKARAEYYRNIAGVPWGMAEQYDLILDSGCGIEETAEQICKAAAARE